LALSGDESIKSDIESYIKGELRSIGDVVMSDSNADWQILVFGIENSTQEHRNTKKYVNIGMVILRPYRSNDLKGLLNKTDLLLNERQEKLIDWMTKNLYFFEEYRLFVGEISELKTLYEKVVAYFDAKCLELQRKAYAEERNKQEKGDQD